MTTTPDNLLSLLRNMTDDQFSSALAMDPELIKKAQKALLDAKQKKIDIDKVKNLELLASTGRLFDEKYWTRLKRLVTGPYNDVNALDFKALLTKTDINIAPEGEMSLMQISLDYLSERNRVVMDWPVAILSAGAQLAYGEINSLIKLVNSRGSINNNLGNQAVSFFSEVFLLPQPWAQHEKQLTIDGTITTSLLQFYQDTIFPDRKFSSLASEWLVIETLARAGCEPLSIAIDYKSYQSCTSWEGLMSQPPQGQDVADAKLSALKFLINAGWCDTGVTSLSDNLRSPLVGHSLTPNCGSRSSLLRMPLDNIALDLFECLCERESKKGFERYDSVGRSRLYFANERMRKGNLHAPELKVLLSIAQRCIELGDAPESVNSQDPISKAASADFRQLLAVAIERRELGSIASGSNSSRPKPRSL